MGIRLRVQFRSFVLKSTSTAFQRLNIPVCHDISWLNCQVSGMLDHEMFPDHGMFMFALMEVAASVPIIICIAQITSKFTYYTLLVYHWLSDLCTCEQWLQLLFNFPFRGRHVFCEPVSQFLLLKWQRNPNRAVRWCLNWVGTMQEANDSWVDDGFSGYLYFKNFPFKSYILAKESLALPRCKNLWNSQVT